MSDYIKEKVEEIQNILIRSLPPVENMPTAILQQNKIDERLDLIEKVSAKIGRIFQSSLQEMEERTREEERKIRLYDPNELKRQGAKILEDQRAIWKKAYELGYREGVHEGYNQKMNDSLSHKKESGEKECECNAPCYCHCHCNKKIMCGHAGEYSCQHCSPKKEKRGR